MPEPNQDFDFSFYVLSVIGYWILADDALATPDGCEKVRGAFRTGMLAAGSFEELQQVPEFVAAMRDVEIARRTGVIVLDPTAPSQTESVPAERTAQ
jgi:hypothetical protein